MVPPTGFLKLVEHISGRFDCEQDMRLRTRAVCPRGAAASACSAAIAALVNGGFLQWADDHELMRGDVNCTPPTRRTA
jgi:hypothetical protein